MKCHVRAKMAKYHSLAKYLAIYHCFQNILENTVVLKLESKKLEFYM